MEKTAMQELQQFMHQWTSLDGKSIIFTVEYLNHFITTLLPKERQQIIDAYNNGYREGEIDGVDEGRVLPLDISEYDNANNYFTQTYQK